MKQVVELKPAKPGRVIVAPAEVIAISADDDQVWVEVSSGSTYEVEGPVEDVLEALGFTVAKRCDPEWP